MVKILLKFYLAKEKQSLKSCAQNVTQLIKFLYGAVQCTGQSVLIFASFEGVLCIKYLLMCTNYKKHMKKVSKCISVKEFGCLHKFM